MYTFPLGDHQVLLDTGNDTVHVANPVAARIKILSSEGHTPDVIAEQIAAEHGVAPSVVLADIRAFLADTESATGNVVEAIIDYVPITDFVPTRPVEPVATRSYYLPHFRVEVTSETPALFTHLDPLLPLPPKMTAQEHVLHLNVYHIDGHYPVVHNGVCLDTGLDLVDAAIKCVRETTVLATRYYPWLMIIHAAAVARGEAGILIPAVGGSGKTTLSAYLMARGYAYLNDDVVPLLADGQSMWPVPANLSIKRGSWKLLAPDYPELTALTEYGHGERRLKYLPPQEHQVRTQPVRCRMVLLPDYSAAYTDARIEAVSAVEVFQGIIEGGCSIDHPVQPQELQTVVAWLNEIPCYRISYNQLAQAHQAIESLLNKLPAQVLALK